jgi:hypothetical protein
MEDVGIFNGHSVLFTAIGYSLWPFGIVNGYLVYFSRFGTKKKKNLATLVFGCF